MSEKIYTITEKELLIRIFNSVNEFKKCINEYDSLITDKIITLNNYEVLLYYFNLVFNCVIVINIMLVKNFQNL